MTRHALRIVVAAALLLAAGFAVSAQDAYPVRLQLPFKKGEKYRQRIAARQGERTRTWTGDVLMHEGGQQYSVALQVLTTVVEVDKRGVPRRESHRVEKCQYIEQGQAAVELLKPGSVIETFIQDGQDVYLIDGKPAPSKQRLMLSLTLPQQKDAVTDDDMFGSAAPRRPGESWPVSVDQVIRMLNASDIQAPKERIAGEVKMTGPELVGNVACLRFDTNLTVGVFSPPLLRGLKVEDGQMGWTSTILLPADGKRKRLHDETKLRMTFRAAGRLGDQAAPIRLESQTAQEISHDYEYVK